jgi:hypothetical protein
MLIAIADLAVLVAAIGPVTVLLVLAALAIFAGGVVAGRLFTASPQRATATTRHRSTPIIRRRA